MIASKTISKEYLCFVDVAAVVDIIVLVLAAAVDIIVLAAPVDIIVVAAVDIIEY